MIAGEENISMNTCENRASFRFTWPGRDESFICSGHSVKLQIVADAIDFHLQLIPVEKGEQLCRQKVSGQKCRTCDGCGLIANDDDRSPWRYWEELKPPANISVVMGLVRPELCPACNGDCYVSGAETAD